MPSPYRIQENEGFSYEFQTDNSIRYLTYFLDYSGMFADYPTIAANVYMFNIDVLNGNPDSESGDERIGITIFEIFKLFFRKSENVVVYVCDNADDRHLSRKRKFDMWFWKFNDGSLLKEDDLAVIEGVEIYNSMILHKNNPYLKELILSFKELNERTNQK